MTHPGPHLVLTINPGATSTKIALFRDEALVKEQVLRHGDAELSAAGRVTAQGPFRTAAVRAFLAAEGITAGALHAVVGRGGLLRPLESGTYAVDDAMIADLERGERGEHASNLGGIIARALAAEHDAPAFIVDPVCVDELADVARVSGMAGITRDALCHALNTKAVARRYAREQGKAYADLRLIVVHLGSGISVSAHEGGRMIDSTNPRDEGPLSPERSGALPLSGVVRWCFESGTDAKAVMRQFFGGGGLYSYLGTRDLRVVMQRVDAGDAQAALLVRAMIYQIGKAIGEMATVLEGRIDAIVLTGGMAHEPRVVEGIAARVGWIAGITCYPGEDELPALAAGALRVLRGEEPARTYAT